MREVLHSSKTQEWYTPDWLLDMVKEVLGVIALDPASTARANERVNAESFFTKEDNAITQNWDTEGSIFLNPPGGKKGGKSLTCLFWEKLMKSKFQDAIFLAYSIEALQTTQNILDCDPIGEFPFCVPKKRIKFISPEGEFNSPTHGSVIVYVRGTRCRYDRFHRAFYDIGSIL